MAAWFIQLANNPSATDFPFVNCSTVDIAAGVAVIVDATNTLSSTNVVNVDGIAVKLPTGDGQACVGITMEILKAGPGGGVAGPGGRVRCFGPIAAMTASGVITAGVAVMAESATGNAKAQTAALYQIGIALTGAVTTADPVMVMLANAKNA